MGKILLDLTEVKRLCDEGHSVLKISEIMNKSHGTIYSAVKRCKFDVVPSKRKKLDLDEIFRLANEGFSCAEIGRISGNKDCSVYAALIRNNISFFNGKYNRPKTLSELEKSVLIGTLYGDSCLSYDGGVGANPSFTGGHCIKQEDYCKWKLSFFTSIKITSYNYSPRPDKRTGKVYDVFGFKSERNECFWEFKAKSYNSDGIKIISRELLDLYYTPLSLAIHYMDDGNKKNSSKNCIIYSIATMGFDIESVEIFKLFLYEKFNIESSIRGSGVLAIKTRSNKTFVNLIEKYMHKDMIYKI